MLVKRRRMYKRMYAVSREGLGLIAGTLAYSRRSAIEHFTPLGQWEMYKATGYRTVVAMVKVIDKHA